MSVFTSPSLMLSVFFALALLFCGTTVCQAHEHHDAKASMTMAMTAAFVSEQGIGIYAKISDYLEKKTGIETDFLTGLSYGVVNKMVEAGATDIAFVCGYPYILSHDGKDDPPMQLLAAPVMASDQYEGKPVYYSYIVVHKDSKAASFADLKGKSWVYNDPTSNSGYNMPRAKLIEMGETEGFFSAVSKSGSHEESMRQVAEGRADASAIDSLVFDYAQATGAGYIKNLKIIDKLGPAGIPPVVYSSHISPEYKQAVQDALLHMHEDPEGRAILKEAFLDRFVAVDDTLFDGVRKWHAMAVDANFMEIK